MERRFAARREQLLADAEVDPRIPRGVLSRLERFLDPFVVSLQRSEQGQHARTYVAGLLSQLESKNVESIAYLHDQEREPLQQFIGQSPWDAQLWLAELARQVGQQLGSPDGVLVFDPSAFPKKGNASVGVQRQWCGRLGKLDNCQVGLYLAYVGRGTSTPSSMSACTCPRIGPRPRSGVPRRASPGAASARGTNWPWRCWMSVARCCRTPGFPVTTNWDVAPGSARSCGRGGSATCWPYRRTRRCAT